MTTPTPKVTKVEIENVAETIWRDADDGCYWPRIESCDDPRPTEYVALPRADHDRLVGALAAARAYAECVESMATPDRDWKADFKAHGWDGKEGPQTFLNNLRRRALKGD